MEVYYLTLILGVLFGGLDIGLNWFTVWSLVRFPFWVLGTMLAGFIVYWIVMGAFCLEGLFPHVLSPGLLFLALVRFEC